MSDGERLSARQETSALPARYHLLRPTKPINKDQQLRKLNGSEDFPQLEAYPRLALLLSGWPSCYVTSTPSRRKSRYGDIDYDFEHGVNTTWANVSLRTRLRELLSEGQYQPYGAGAVSRDSRFACRSLSMDLHLLISVQVKGERC